MADIGNNEFIESQSPEVVKTSSNGDQGPEPVWKQHGFPSQKALDDHLRKNLVPYGTRMGMISGREPIPKDLLSQPSIPEPLVATNNNKVSPDAIDNRPTRTKPGVYPAEARKMPLIKADDVRLSNEPVVIPVPAKRSEVKRPIRKPPPPPPSVPLS